MATDPICQIEVDEATAEFRGFVQQIEEAKYYFCSARCMELFRSHPGPYTLAEAEDRATAEGMPAKD